jgi:hypothetical protein
MSVRERQGPRPYDEVELRASKQGNSMLMLLSRAAAEARSADLASEGWSVEIVDDARSDLNTRSA